MQDVAMPAFLVAVAFTLGYPLTVWVDKVENEAGESQEGNSLVSVVWAVHSEAALSRAKCRNLLSKDYTPALLEIIVVSDGSADETFEEVVMHAVKTGLPA